MWSNNGTKGVDHWATYPTPSHSMRLVWTLQWTISWGVLGSSITRLLPLPPPCVRSGRCSELSPGGVLGSSITHLLPPPNSCVRSGRCSKLSTEERWGLQVPQRHLHQRTFEGPQPGAPDRPHQTHARECRHIESLLTAGNAIFILPGFCKVLILSYLKFIGCGL